MYSLLLLILVILTSNFAGNSTAAIAEWKMAPLAYIIRKCYDRPQKNYEKKKC